MRLRFALVLIAAQVSLAAFNPPADERARDLFGDPQPRPVGIAGLAPEEGDVTAPGAGSLCASLRASTYESGSAVLIVDDRAVETMPEHTLNVGPNAYEEYCWPGVLSPGLHVADLRLKLIASQQVQTYSWAFEVTE